MDLYLLAGLVWSCTFVLALSAWPLRKQTAPVRLLVLTPIWTAIAVLPLFLPATPAVLKFLVLVLCGILAARLFDFHMSAGHWQGRGFREWVLFLLHPMVLVHRCHVREKPRPVRASLILLLRGLLEVAAGVGLFLWAVWQELGQYSFWLDHAVKLLAAYLGVFDGGFVTATAVLRLLGSPMMDVSREPILAVTPADFWRRYNRNPGQLFHEDVFKPLGGIHAPVRGILVSFLVNGLYHEYLAWALTGELRGYQLTFFLLQGLAVAATFRLRPRSWTAILGMMLTIVFNLLVSVFFFATIEQVFGWYSHGALLP
jgi:hypothetical protein